MLFVFIATLFLIPENNHKTLIFINRMPVKLIKIYLSNGIFYFCSEMKGFNNILLNKYREMQNSVFLKVALI